MKRIITCTASIALALFILSSSVLITLKMKDSYSLSLNNIEEVEYKLDKETKIKNYNNLIDYMFLDDNAKLKFINLPMSKEGEIHFYEVKLIFKKFIYLFIASLITLVLTSIYLLKNKSYKYLKYGSILVALIPLILSVPILIDFNWTFIKFHEIAFSNNYWIFNPSLDPIIRYLPESLFFLNTIIILFIILLELTITLIIYKKLKNKQRTN